MKEVKRATFTAKEAAEYLGVSYWLITRLCKQGKMPHSRIGGRLILRKEKLDVWLNNMETRSIQEEKTDYGKIRKIMP